MERDWISADLKMTNLENVFHGLWALQNAIALDLCKEEQNHMDRILWLLSHDIKCRRMVPGSVQTQQECGPAGSQPAPQSASQGPGQETHALEIQIPVSKWQEGL